MGKTRWTRLCQVRYRQHTGPPNRKARDSSWQFLPRPSAPPLAAPAQPVWGPGAARARAPLPSLPGPQQPGVAALAMATVEAAPPALDLAPSQEGAEEEVFDPRFEFDAPRYYDFAQGSPSTEGGHAPDCWFETSATKGGSPLRLWAARPPDQWAPPATRMAAIHPPLPPPRPAGLATPSGQHAAKDAGPQQEHKVSRGAGLAAVRAARKRGGPAHLSRPPDDLVRR